MIRKTNTENRNFFQLGSIYKIIKKRIQPNWIESKKIKL